MARFDFMALGAEVRFLEYTGGAMLYDSSRAGNAVAGWLDAEWWRGRGSLTPVGAGRGAACFIEADGRSLVLRHYRRGGLVARVLRDRYLWRSAERTRSFREWHLLYQLQRAGLPVPVPVAAGFRRRGSSYTCDLLVQRIPATRTLAACVAAGPLPIERWIALGRTLRQFHVRGVCHADLNAHNVLLGEGTTDVWLVDFDRGSLRAPGWWCDANLARLHRSLAKICTGLPPEHFAAADWHALLDSYFAAAAPPLPA
jgi:3-deoxy-D-manno-octulosonic acid kinase